MYHSNDFTTHLDIIAKILLRCFIMGIVLLLIWFLLFWLLSGFIYDMHSRWFHITREQFDWIMYLGMALMKMFIICVFLFPYISIRLVLNKYKDEF